MQRYFFHVHFGYTIRDPSGTDYPSREAAERSAQSRLQHLLKAAGQRSVTIVVTNAEGDRLFEAKPMTAPPER